MKSKNIILKITGTKCNMNCDYCFEDKQNKSKKNLSPETIFNFVDNYKELDYIHFSIHGGEPLLYKKSDLKRILYYLDDFPVDHRIQIQTNGTLIDSEWVDIFKEVNSDFAISISMDPKGEMDARKGVKDYRTIIFNNIRLLRNANIPIGIVSVLHSKNKDSFNDYINELISLNVNFLTINRHRESHLSNIYNISELEYVISLEKILMFYITNSRYKEIDIQPFLSYFTGINSCIYMYDNNKCNNFVTLYPDKTIECDHKKESMLSFYGCHLCNIKDECGGGCPYEPYDPTFCEARKRLFKLINKINKIKK